MTDIYKIRAGATNASLSDTQNEQTDLDKGFHNQALDNELVTLLQHPRVMSLLRSVTQDITYEFNDEKYKYPPRRAYAGDAGLDIAIQEDVTIYPGESEYLSLIHISEPTRLGMISYAVFCRNHQVVVSGESHHLSLIHI